MAGLDTVLPPRSTRHWMLQWLSEAKSMLVSGAPGKKFPVPKTMPVPPPARKLPTAVDESTVWFVSYEQIRLPPLPMTRRWPPAE